MAEHRKQLVACPECDLLLFEIELRSGHTAVCPRCKASLYRKTTESLSRTLALCLAAAIFFLIANFFPIMGIESRGNGNETNLFGAVSSLWDQEMHFISAVVFISAIAIPGLELFILIYLLLPLKLGLKPPGLARLMRYLQRIEPWGMVEVFMLGILVALVKLTDNFRIIPGVALWSFGAVTFLMAAIATTFNPRDVWTRLEWESSGKGHHEE
jgi:paraquat-inducible protein A